MQVAALNRPLPIHEKQLRSSWQGGRSWPFFRRWLGIALEYTVIRQYDTTAVSPYRKGVNTVISPQVTISAGTFARLQRCAEPLVDDIESVINKLIDNFETKPSTVSPPTSPNSVGATPDLSWTKLMSAEIAGKPLVKVDWNALLIAMIELAATKAKPGDEVAELIIVNRVVGSKTINGYRFVPSAGVSVQGQDANSCWKAVAHIANKLNIPIKVFFKWYDNEKASKPGGTGKLSLNDD